MLSRLLARHFGSRQMPVPPAILSRLGLHIADSIAIAYAGSRTAEGLPARQWLTACLAGGGTGGCTVLGHTPTLPPAMAAGANAASMHVLDFDDIHDAARLHPTSVCLPAALAAAEVVDAQERAVVQAVAAGVELMCRLGAVLEPSGTGAASHWFLTQLLGYLGATLSAGVVLGLDDDALVSAMGLAYMQAAGGKEAANGLGATARAVYPAFSAMAGTHAALTARAGLKGPASALDGPTGLFALYLRRPLDEAALAALLRPTREPCEWAFLAAEIKPWPCCRLAQPYVAAARAIRGSVDAGAIERIDIAINTSAGRLCEPLAQRCRPTTLQDAKYSIPFLVALTLVHGDASLAVLTQARLADDMVLDLAQRVRLDRSLADRPGHPPARIVVKTRAGQHVESGTVCLPAMEPAAVRRKFTDCLQAGGVGMAFHDSAWEWLTQPESAPRHAIAGLQAALADASRQA